MELSVEAGEVKVYVDELVPSVGFAVSDSGANFIYADLKKDFFLTPHWYLTPSFGVGHFNETDQFRLGQALEFRSGLEGGYRFNNDYRLGLAIFHLSNGGLADENPGTEALVRSFTMPL
ncbi:MAG: acyloxyacyl hydrolase [Gammaproteobacteria bacterium]